MIRRRYFCLFFDSCLLSTVLVSLIWKINCSLSLVNFDKRCMCIARELEDIKALENDVDPEIIKMLTAKSKVTETAVTIADNETGVDYKVTTVVREEEESEVVLVKTSGTSTPPTTAEDDHDGVTPSMKAARGGVHARTPSDRPVILEGMFEPPEKPKPALLALFDAPTDDATKDEDEEEEGEGGAAPV